MDEFSDRLKRARRHVDVAIDDAALTVAWDRLKARQRRRAIGRGATGFLATAATILLAWRLTSVAPESVAVTPGPTATAPDLRLPDGSRVYFLGSDTEVGTSAISSSRVVLTLAAGSARFEVSSRPERTFEVLAAGVSVQVVGTTFDVHRVDGASVEVEVSEGRVRVRSVDGEFLLGPGDHGTFSGREATNDEAPASPDEMSPSASRPLPATMSKRRATREREPTRDAEDWRALAAAGNYDAAWAALERTDDLRADDAGDLLLAADAARLSGHAERAKYLLRTVLESHPDDPRASLAAFTLGRMLLRGRPREAAEAFAASRRLDPASALSQDALAREVEAWHHAGEASRAREAAMDYVSRWPTGARIEAVRAWGGL